ncbi:pyridoxal 5'-phosphate synthase glutaminase subunit PdxT [Romboutsia maritimum]|uniref:Pyridoxal 5'-phosphate synthase subunit PdxT n=1 Tax=Romboutsia maritimum TaxID=2020948 RepID=A0A371IUM3_9FIRM|nr:pyridoxal 5'-phosphate synthase glutaminase subunit PdxT [Romboutsia maritimum]RDY24190.1 pyridoxal 5'-phosphate synthase glutaminase subunit PdxT [Romboutsia maritimum]
MRIGVLAMQGAYKEHINILRQLGIEAIDLRYKEEFENIEGIIIPGGESTSIGKLIKILDIYDVLKDKVLEGMPILGTCAGMIVLAKKIHNQENTHIATMDIEVIRNGYGRQLGSFNTNESVRYIGENIPMVFIRAPYIKSVGKDVEILSVVDDKIVAAKQDNMLVTSFHPELTNNTNVHEYFVKMIKDRQ